MHVRGLALAAALAMVVGCGQAPGTGGVSPRTGTALGPAFGARDAGGATPRAGGAPPVMLVHGHHGSSANWDGMAPRLREAGWEPTAIDFASGNWTNWTMDDFADQLGVHVLAMERKYGVSQVDVVAHSLGGMVVRHYIQYRGGAAHVRRLVCLGTPHHGVSFAAIGFWIDIARLFSPVGSYLRRINSPDESPFDVQYTNVWSPSDWAEWAPFGSGRQAGAFNYKISKTPHADYPADQRVAELVVQSLRRPLDATPGAEVDVGIRP